MTIMLSAGSHDLSVARNRLTFDPGDTHPNVKIQELKLETLLPCLSPRIPNQGPRLSSDGFFDCVVSLALCAGMDMTLGLKNGETISYRALANMGIGVHTAWNIAAYNVVNAARSNLGLSFYHKPWHGGLEFRGDGSPISAWLAHPVLFNIFNKLAVDLLGSSDISYLLPGHGRVMAVKGSSPHVRNLLAAARKEVGGLPYSGFSKPLVWSNGFPKPL